MADSTEIRFDDEVSTQLENINTQLGTLQPISQDVTGYTNGNATMIDYNDTYVRLSTVLYKFFVLSCHDKAKVETIYNNYVSAENMAQETIGISN